MTALNNNRKKHTSKAKLLEKFRVAAASANSSRVPIIPGINGWSVKKEGCKKATYVKSTKVGAIKAANRLKGSSINSILAVILSEAKNLSC